MKQRKLASLGVLGVLSEDEFATVGQIHDKLHHNFGRYWGASTGILTPTISQLEEEGYVEPVRTDREYGYEITPAGRDRLEAILSERIDDISHPSSRPHLMLKLGFLHHLPVERQHDEIESLQDQLFEARDRLHTLEQRHEDESDSFGETGYRGEMIGLRIGIVNALLEWLEDVKPNVD